MEFGLIENVAHLLEMLCSSNSSVSIECVHLEKKATAIVVAVDINAQSFTLGSFSSNKVAEELAAGAPFNLHAIVNHMKVTARSLSVQSSGANRSDGKIWVDFPISLQYHQRRDVYRADAERYSTIDVDVCAAVDADGNTGEATLHRGILKDISVNGCSVLVGNVDASHLEALDGLVALFINTEITPSFPRLFAEVTRKTKTGTEGVYQLGFRFTANDNESRKRLGQFAINIQLMARGSNRFSA